MPLWRLTPCYRLPMVVRRAFEGSLVLAALLAGVAAGGGCGGESSRSVAMVGGSAGATNATGATSTTGATSATGATGGRLDVASAGAGTVGMGAAAGASSDEIGIDGPPCETRRAADCTGVVDTYSSDQGTFDAAPELAACSRYVSFDGCGKLVYSFDVDGCVVSVGPGPGGWRDSGHLSLLRDCLSNAFSEARFSCLASETLAFDESCLIR